MMIVGAMFESMAESEILFGYALLFGRDVYCLHSCSLFLRTKSPVEAAHCVKRGNARVESLLFVDDVARRTSSTDGLQRALDRFGD